MDICGLTLGSKLISFNATWLSKAKFCLPQMPACDSQRKRKPDDWSPLLKLIFISSTSRQQLPCFGMTSSSWHLPTSFSSIYSLMKSEYAMKVQRPSGSNYSLCGTELSMVVCDTRLYSCSSQQRVTLSVLPTARHRSLGLNDIHQGCPVVDTCQDFIVFRVRTSHRRTVWSTLPLTIVEESGEISKHVICSL